MRIQWYGQSAFLFTGGGRRVFIDPFQDMTQFASRAVDWRYPPIEGVSADLLLVTHDHADHNGVDAIGGEPVVIAKAGTTTRRRRFSASRRSTTPSPGRSAGRTRSSDSSSMGCPIAHFGDFGQPALRPEQREALGRVDVVVFPVGGGPTTPVDQAAALLHDLAPRVVVPMHYRTELIGFLDPVEPFLDALGAPVERLNADADLDPLLDRDRTTVALLDPPTV